VYCTSSFFASLCFHHLFVHDTATPDIYTLSLHDALPIWTRCSSTSRCSREASRSRTRTCGCATPRWSNAPPSGGIASRPRRSARSEEHTSELQSRENLVCRLLLEKKKKKTNTDNTQHIQV